MATPRERFAEALTFPKGLQDQGIQEHSYLWIFLYAREKSSLWPCNLQINLNLTLPRN